MLNLQEIKQTKVYQDAKEEGLQQGIQQGIKQGVQQGKLEHKIEMIPSLQELGLNIEKIAQILELEEDIVRKNIT